MTATTRPAVAGPASRVRRFATDNGLSLAFGVLFLVTLIAQSWSGLAEVNHRLLLDGLPPVDWAAYVTSCDFAVDVAENWQSEFLQFLLFIVATVWLVQRGSPESKPPGQQGPEGDLAQQAGPAAAPQSPPLARRTDLLGLVYSNSLALFMLLMFWASWSAQSVAGWTAYNEEQLRSQMAPLRWPEYLVSADFWNRTLQNWQSEFLAVGTMAIVAVFLRQRGSAESKAVGAAHDAQE